MFGRVKGRNIIFLIEFEMRQGLRRSGGALPAADQNERSTGKCRRRVHESFVESSVTLRSFSLQHHKELVDAQLFPVVCAFASDFSSPGFFHLATTPFCDFCSCDTVLLDFPSYKTPTSCQSSDSRISVHIFTTSFKREDGDGATTMEPSSSPSWRSHNPQTKALELIDQVQG